MSQHLPDPATAPELFEGLLLRRAGAYVIDCAIIVLVAIGVSIVGLLAGILTLGIGWLTIPIVIPIAILAYYTLTLGSYRRATVGMATMDLVLTPTRGRPLDGWKILIHPILFWLTVWISWPLSLLFVLFTQRRQMVHDLLTGTLMVRRSPMVRRWQSAGAGTA